MAIAKDLRRAGRRAGNGNHHDDSSRQDGYEGRLAGLARFGDLHAAFNSLQRLDAIYREYREAADRVGTCAVRDLVARARGRVEKLARSPRLSADKRREKLEITQWCKVWLEVPDLFYDWLEMRRQTPEFQKDFAHRNGWGLKQG